MPPKPKLTVEQRLDLIEKYDIRFEGPIPPSKWPAQYRRIFQDIRNIQRMRYDEYEVNNSRDLITVAAMKKRVNELARIAYDCLKKRENERTWRMRTEPLVVFRFGQEVVCQICDKRLWQSEFRTVPDDMADAEHLRRRRARRNLCECDPITKASEDLTSNKDSEEPLFSNRSERKVYHDPGEIKYLLECGLGLQEPDRVFGLEKTMLFRKYLPNRPSLRTSPFKDRHVLFPFLIIEAKSEKGSAGFESIETQTAFPIRTLVRLQHDLQKGSGFCMNPLVWFLANRGEEWRVYACVSDRSRLDEPTTRVIDLWHGTVLSQDCALQLLQIIDTICDWARDIFRKSVLHCLAGAEVNMRDFTPYTVISDASDNGNSQQEQDRADIWSVPTTPTPAGPASPSPDASEEDLDFFEDHMAEIEESSDDIEEPHEENEGPAGEVEAIDIDMQDVHLTLQDRGSGALPSENKVKKGDQRVVHISSLDDSHPLLRFSRIHPDSSHWSREVTIRHSNIVRFEFQHIPLPEHINELKAFLSPPEESTADVMDDLSRALLAGVVLTLNGIHLLEQSWTRAPRKVLPENDPPLLAWAFLEVELRANDWQLIRSLTCITASRPAMESLVYLTRSAEILRLYRSQDWTPHRCPCLITDLQSVRSLRDKPSATTAVLGTSLCLTLSEQRNGEKHLSWSRSCPFNQEHSTLTCQMANSPHDHKSECLEEVLLRRSAPKFLRESRLEMGSIGALLLKKGRGWPKIAPRFCLLVFDGSDFEDAPSLGRKIREVCDAGDSYLMWDAEDDVMDNEDTTECVLDDGEMEKIKAWVDILEGKSRTDTLLSLP